MGHMEVTLFIACIAGIISYKHLKECFRIQVVHVTLYLMIHLIIAVLPFLLPASHPALLPKLDLYLASYIYVFVPFFEISLLLLSFHYYFKNKMISTWLLCFYVIFVSLSVISVIRAGVINYSYVPYVAGGIAVVIVSTFMLYKNMMYVDLNTQEKKAGITMSLGLMIYFGCNTPLLCMVNGLSDHEGFVFLIYVIFHIRYLLTAYAFWCFRNTPRHIQTIEW